MLVHDSPPPSLQSPKYILDLWETLICLYNYKTALGVDRVIFMEQLIFGSTLETWIQTPSVTGFSLMACGCLGVVVLSGREV